MVIAIDGPAGAGKSTVARGLAAALGITYLDSGAMYRCVALEALRRDADLEDADQVSRVAEAIRIEFEGERVLLDGADVSGEIRLPRVSAAASRVSVHPRVRAAMVARQRELIEAAPYVAEGRDIGTVVSPDAPLKVFLTASDDERARRRATQSGEDESAVLAAQSDRDRRDVEREHGALRPAHDAVEIDTTGVEAAEVIARIATLARERGLTPSSAPDPDPAAAPDARPTRRRVAARKPRIAVVGFPNVGKSTLVNRLSGGRDAVVHAEAGVTRDRKELDCEWNGREFKLIDTGGVDLEATDGISRAVQEQARTAIADADAIALVLDAKAGLRAGDAEVARILRGSESPVIVVANKVDGPADEPSVADLYALGLGEPSPVSASQGLGIGDLLDRMTAAIGSADADDDAAADLVRIAVIGRPNVGKSSLVNAFLGSDRVIVSEQAGTTRDAIDTELWVGEREVVLVDTAGLRRRSKVAGTVDYYAQLRSERAAERADVAIVVCDASEGVTAEDLRVADLAMKTGCATLVALNKWDVVQLDLDDAKARIASRVRQRPPVITTSAERGRNVPKLLATAIELADRRAERIPTPKLNRFVASVVARHPPPAKRGKRLRLYYAAQVGTRPPRIAIQVNDKRVITRNWAFHLENRLREEHALEGVPLIIDFIPKKVRHGGDRA